MSGNNELEYLCLTSPDEIGASCHALVCGNDETVVVDSGLHPKQLGYEATPPHQLLKGHRVRSVVLTHSHLDHAGTIPVLQQTFPESKVYMTPGTYDLTDALLHNSVNVMKSQREELGVDEYPLFTHGQIDEANLSWEPRPYNCLFDTGADSPVEFYFQDAGHILGSCTATVHYEGKKVMFTGDVQTEDQTLIKGAEIRPESGGLDALIMETTRGHAPRPAGFTREQEEARFAAAITEGIQRGGAVLIPVFAMGKTQEILTMLYQFKSVGMIPDVPVHVGGLGTKMTTIYDKHAKRSRRKAERFRILRDMDLRMARRGNRAPIVPKAGEIFCLSSGMMTENTVSNKFARKFLDDDKNSLLFVGYADPDSPAGKIKAAENGDLIHLDEIRPPVELSCEVTSFDFSGHAPREDLLELAIQSGAKKIFLIHGDRLAREWFQAELRKALPETEVIIPEKGERYTI